MNFAADLADCRRSETKILIADSLDALRARYVLNATLALEAS